jgi:hypothetical protein
MTIGWRYFRDELDPKGLGDASKIGKQAIDFIGQTEEERSYAERQRFPGDYEVQVSQRPIAVHALENLGTSDRGVAMLRRLVRNAIRSNEMQPSTPSHGGVIGTYCQDTVWPAQSRTATSESLGAFGRVVADCVLDSGADTESERRVKLRAVLESRYPSDLR